ncbi:MAG: response regulator transcription factor [Eubacteriaceae bacterium]|nr:response regulator transcription factor [Eubacteriaceae bacterium]
MKILLIEDEKDLADALTAILLKNNYSVDNAYEGEYGLDCALTCIYDLIILDVMLPKLDGFAVLAHARGAGITTPVLMLTARGETRDKVAGLEAGADDYLPKPFAIDELLARIKALGRRKGEYLAGGEHNLGNNRLFNPMSLELKTESGTVNLTLKESQLLELLLSHRNTYTSKDMIIEKLWSYDADVVDSHVESQVSLLRKKLSAACPALSIKASRGVGYRLEGLDDV